MRILPSLKSRPVRKFVRSPLALTALGVILCYALVGLLGIVGVISVADATERIGAKTVRGFGLKSDPELRLEQGMFYLEHVERVLKAGDFEQAARDAALAERRLAAAGKEELETALEEGFAIVDELSEVEDLGETPEAAAKLDALDAMAIRLMPVPDGWPGLKYKFRVLLGTDRQGRSIMMRSLYSVKIALQVGVIVGLIAVVVGSILGAMAAFFRGWVDQAVQWLYSTFSSIPNLVLLALLVYMFTGSRWDGTLIPVYVALSATFWIGPCRVVRGEVLKIREMEYVQAATAIGFQRGYIVLKHVLPNTIHLMLINFSLLFIAAIKSEVILTFLGLGVKEGASWGLMISQATQEVINGFFWQIGAATAFMFVLVLAFNIVSDALQDAFDPKHVG